MQLKPLTLSASLLVLSQLISLPSTVLAANRDDEMTELPQITVVTAAGREQEIVDAPASITVITKEELEHKEYRDLTDALLAVPGVSVEGGTSTSGKGGSPQVSIRGMDPKYTLILVNGRAQNSSQSYYNGFGSGAEYSWLTGRFDSVLMVLGLISLMSSRSMLKREKKPITSATDKASLSSAMS